jgi:hypothetical protein
VIKKKIHAAIHPIILQAMKRRKCQTCFIGETVDKMEMMEKAKSME